VTALLTDTATFDAIGTTAAVVVTDPSRLGEAERLLRAELAALDLACSRFRPDSEIRRVEAASGASVVVSPLLGACLDAALRAAELTDGLVDPTVGGCLDGLGYDRDLPTVTDGPARRVPAPGWWRLGWDPRSRRLVVPRGIRVDLGSTGKAHAADRAAALIHAHTEVGVLVNLGGDLAMAGPVPPGGWRVRVGEDHAVDDPQDPVVTIHSGGLATSGTTRRRWRRDGAVHHHIVDPRTGMSTAELWRTVTVAAATCLDANIAATAALVVGADAPDWLAAAGLPARLVGTDGDVRHVGGWV